MSVESEGITRTAAVPDAEGSEVLERSASDGGDASRGGQVIDMPSRGLG